MEIIKSLKPAKSFWIWVVKYNKYSAYETTTKFIDEDGYDTIGEAHFIVRKCNGEYGKVDWKSIAVMKSEEPLITNDYEDRKEVKCG